MSKKEDYSRYLKEKFPPKEGFVKRIETLLGEAEAKKFFEIAYTKTPVSIRCNTLKISVEELKTRLENYGWKLKQPFEKFPEVMVVE